MFRQSPRSRNARNKGLKIKHVLQMSALFGASIWLLYQVQHTDNKKPQVTTNISGNLHKDSSNDMIKLGRKGLRPRGKETNVQDKKETLEHEADEDNNENEAEELLVQGHESEGTKQDEVGENASMNDGMEKNTKTGSEELKEEMKGGENEEDGVKNEKIETDGMKQTHEEAIKEANRRKKSKEGDMDMNMSIPSEENNKESRQESKYEENGRKKEVKEEKEDDNQMQQPNPNEVVEIASPPEDDDEENVSSEEVNDNRRRKENGEKRKENGSNNKGPCVDESQSGSNPIHSKRNEDNKDSSSNMEKVTEEETSTTTSNTKLVKNRKIGNLSRQRMWIKSVKKKTSPVASFEVEPKKDEGK